MNINDFKDMAEVSIAFVFKNCVRGAANERGKQLVEKKSDKKDSLLTRKDIVNFVESICFVLVMSLTIYAFCNLLVGENIQKRITRSATTSTLAYSILAVTPKRIIDKQENES